MIALLTAETALPPGALLAAIVLGVAEVALAVFCIVDIVRRPAVLGDRKWLWIALVVLLHAAGVDHLPGRRPRARAGGRVSRRRGRRRPAPGRRGRDALYAPARRRRHPEAAGEAADGPGRDAQRPAGSPPSRSPASPRPTSRRAPSTASTSSCPRAPCSAFSGPTAPARRPRCASSPGWRARPQGPRRVFGHDVDARRRRGPRPDRLPAGRARLLQVDDGHASTCELSGAPVRPAPAPCCASASRRCSSSPASPA